ncbi:MAG: murein L,D-transpeptidase catalytic domain family protein [Bacteroidetes bacterium]|nr:murein L,D-transpeptidase catalytic domain family protein [Bacteroidota bacterium]
MKRSVLWVTCILLLLSVTIISWKAENPNKDYHTKSVIKAGKLSARALFAQYLTEIYNNAQLHAAGLDFEVFEKAATGFFNLKSQNQVGQTRSILTVVDLAKSSSTKRMWIIDMLDKELLMHTWVAHGNGSGRDMASYFSNQMDSHASSLGFYITEGIYQGKHGRSLKLEGLDAGFNDNARARSIVVHGAKYVSEGTINALGRLGLSEGCPAVSTQVVGKVIETIKDGTVLFINGNDNAYTSKYLDGESAANYVYPESNAYENASL